MRIALATLGLFLLLGGVVKLKRGCTASPTSNSTSGSEKAAIGLFDNELIVPHIALAVSPGAPEASWRDALSRRLGGRSESQVEFGRIDVLTDTYAIEIDFIDKWQEGVGQALHYGDASSRTSCLALILTETSPDMKKIGYIDRLCRDKGVVLLLLTSSETTPSASTSVVDDGNRHDE